MIRVRIRLEGLLLLARRLLEMVLLILVLRMRRRTRQMRSRLIAAIARQRTLKERRPHARMLHLRLRRREVGERRKRILVPTRTRRWRCRISVRIAHQSVVMRTTVACGHLRLV